MLIFDIIPCLIFYLGEISSKSRGNSSKSAPATPYTWELKAQKNAAYKYINKLITNSYARARKKRLRLSYWKWKLGMQCSRTAYRKI